MTVRSVARVAGRALLAAAVLAAFSTIALQYARIVHRNLVLAHTLWATQSDIARLSVERDRRQATIKRLEDPRGAIPEIHDRLHLVFPGEAIIYVKQR